MHVKKLSHSLLLSLLTLALVAPAPNARAQQPSPPKTQPQSALPQDDATDVLRVETELVQTAIMVVDKNAKFVEGLRRDQFEMRIDGKPQPISFFEQVEMGTPKERQQLAAAQGDVRATADGAASERALTVFLFADDLHLDASTYFRVRQAMLHYIDKVMGDNTQAAVVSTSGQIGFLQQLTDDKSVLHQAVARFNLREAGRDQARPPISVYQALAVQENDDAGVKNYLVQQTMHEERTDTDPLLMAVGKKKAEADVDSRTRAILERERSINRMTFSTLESLLRTSAQLPGRKLVFFFSGGFMLQTKSGDERDRMSHVVDAAARANAVVYTVDARGLATDPSVSASLSGAFDPYGLSTRTTMGMGELPASQQGLLNLAGDTGGRAILNTNDLDAGVNRALDESSRYYLLAWRPEAEANRGGKFRHIEVSVTGRPDLTVRLHRGYYSPGSQAATKISKTPAVLTPQAELNAAVTSAYPRNQLPALLVAHYAASAEAGATLVASVGISSEWLTFKAADDGRSVAAVDLVCAIIDDNGKQLQNLSTRVDVSTRAGVNAGDAPRRDVMRDFQFKDLKPGLYQVRAAAREAGSSRIGSVTRWIDIPDLANGQLGLGSLVIAETAGSGAGNNPVTMLAVVKPIAGRPLSRGSRLHFSADIYNAARPAGQLPPSVTVRAVVLAGARVLADTGEREVTADGIDDVSRLPFSDEIDLAASPPGFYVLQVTATDHTGGKSVTQLAKFSIR